jgi:glycosyltransferase involved in cell wall biosynthesis
MIQSLQVEGTCLQVTQFDKIKLNQIYELGFVKSFALSENLLGQQQLSHPYFQIINLSQVSDAQTVNHSDLFLGYILKLKDSDQASDLGDIFSFLDLEVSSARQAIKFCLKLDSHKKFKIFPTLKLNGRIKEMNQFISWIEQNKSPRHLRFFKKPYDLESMDWTDWVSLESYKAPVFEQSITDQKPILSVIIPHYESQYFVTNTLRHLSLIDKFEQIEVLLIDDGSKESSLQFIQYCANRQFPRLPLKIFSWGDQSKLRTQEKIFRAGSSRNWGAQMARSQQLFFLDADMLVPSDILSRLESSLKFSEVVQFKRLHIPYFLSNGNVDYKQALNNEHLFVEEEDYWSELFNCNDWMEISDHWKMTCTYALAIQKPLFDQVGRFRRHYIRYGFEDTDLGFRLSQHNCKFYLDKTPLLHLTQSRENTQSFMYKLKKMNRIQKMAKVFYLSNLNSKLYRLFHSFY